MQVPELGYKRFNISNIVSPGPLRGESEPVLCQDCGKTVNHLGSLREHRFRVHGIVEGASADKIHACSQCEQTFLKESNLKIHVLKRHEDFRPFKCPWCEYRGNQFFTLGQHFRLVHKRRIKRRFVNVDKTGKLGYEGKPYVIYDVDTGEELVTVRNSYRK